MSKWVSQENDHYVQPAPGYGQVVVCCVLGGCVLCAPCGDSLPARLLLLFPPDSPPVFTELFPDVKITTVPFKYHLKSLTSILLSIDWVCSQ